MEVFSAQGRDPVSQWKLTGSVKKDYDKSLKGYVYRMEGGSSTTSTRMQLPKNEKLSCELCLKPLPHYQNLLLLCVLMNSLTCSISKMEWNGLCFCSDRC